MVLPWDSSLQIALLVAPLLVFASYLFGAPLDLIFTPFEVAAVTMSVLVVGFVAMDGESNWMEGAMLVGVYLMLAIAFSSCQPSRMLKKAASFVLSSTKSSTYPEGTPPVSTRLRPCWTVFLSILHALFRLPLTYQPMKLQLSPTEVLCDWKVAHPSGAPFSPVSLFARRSLPQKLIHVDDLRGFPQILRLRICQSFRPVLFRLFTKLNRLLRYSLFRLRLRRVCLRWHRLSSPFLRRIHIDWHGNSAVISDQCPPDRKAKSIRMVLMREKRHVCVGRLFKMARLFTLPTRQLFTRLP